MDEQKTHAPDGVPVTLGGCILIAAPLTFKQLKELGPDIARVKTFNPLAMEDEDFAAVTRVCLASLRRNHPALTDKELDEVLDLGNFRHVWGAMMGLSGLVPKAGEMAAGSR